MPFEVVQIVTPTGKTDDVLKIDNTSSSSDVSYTFGDILELDNEYTFSCWMRSDASISTTVYLSNNSKSFALTSAWTRVIYTATSNITASKEVRFTIPAGKVLYAYQGQLEVGNKVSDFSENPDDIKETVTDNSTKISVLQTNFTVQQGQIEALIKETTIDGTSLSDKFNQIEATVDGLNVSIGDVQSDVNTMNSKITSLQLTTDGLTTQVSQAGTDIEEAKSIANQAADKISWLVASGSSETNFTLTDRTATLVSEQINLKGLVSFSGLTSDVQDKINSADEEKDPDNLIPTYLFPTGANIQPWDTGTALSHTLGQADPYGGNDALYLKPIASNPQMKINKGGVLRQTGTHTFSIWMKSSKEGTINIYINASTANLENKYQTFNVGTEWQLYSLTVDVTDLLLDFDILIGGFSTWTDMEFDLYIYKPKLVYGTGSSVLDLWIKDAVTSGTTNINGGYIQTQTINTDQLAVDDIFATGSAVMNVINAQEISADRITSGTIKSNYLELYGLSVLQKDTDIQTLNIDDNGNVTMRGSVESYNYVSGESGWSIKSDGNAEFNDVVVRGDLIANNAGIVKGTEMSTPTNIVTDPDQEITVASAGASSRFGSFTVSGLTVGTYNIDMDVSTTASSFDLIVEPESASMVQMVKTEGNTYHGTVEFTGTIPSSQTWNLLTTTGISSSITISNISVMAETAPRQVRFWAGADYDQRDSAPFKVYSDGSISATKGTYSGIWTGDIQVGNISIIDPSTTAGNDAILTIRNGQNGIKTVQLTDTDVSSFAQDVNITDNMGNPVIELQQGGGIIAGGVTVSGATSSTVIAQDNIMMGKSSIYGNDSGIKFTTPSINIGEPGTQTGFNVHGNSYFNGITTLFGDINFGTAIVCTVSYNGLDFNMNEEELVSVQFNTNGGSLIEAQYIKAGSKATKPDDPTKGNNEFSGWYKDPGLSNEFNFTTEVVNESIILYAKWSTPSSQTLYV